MFNDNLTQTEKYALLITLAHLSKDTNVETYSELENRTIYKYIKITNSPTNLSVSFDINNQQDCGRPLIQLLQHVFYEYNFIHNNIESDTDILNNFALLTNGLIRQIKEDSTHLINNSSDIINKLQQQSDHYTLQLLTDKKITEEEKTCIVLVRHLIDNILSGCIFSDGLELLDFMNGTKIIADLLCLNATLYDENTYYNFYQQSN